MMKPLILYVPGLTKKMKKGKCQLIFRRKTKNILIEEEGKLIIRRNYPDALWYLFSNGMISRNEHMTLSDNQARRVEEYFELEGA